MAEDIRLDVTVFDHPKILELEEALGGAAAFKALLRLWAFAAQNHQDGDLSSMTSRRIALAAKWPVAEADKFVEALRSIGLLDGSTIHDWGDHQPFVSTAPARSHAARIAAKARWDKRIMRGASAHDASRMRVASNRNAPSPDPSPSPTPDPSPDPYPDPDLRAAHKPSARRADAEPPAKPASRRGQESHSSDSGRRKAKGKVKSPPEATDPAKLEAAIAKERERNRSGGMEALQRIGERMGFVAPAEKTADEEFSAPPESLATKEGAS